MIWRWGVVIALVRVIGVGQVFADVTTERGSSILIFPKVIYDSQGLIGGQVDTLIQISNTSNSLVFAHCFYVNAAPQNPAEPAGVLNPSQWQEIDFDIFLTKQQPTHWVLSGGRVEDTSDKSCGPVSGGGPPFSDCFNAGFDPGKIPPAPDDPFVGELKCIEVDSAGAPINGNHLKGEATIVNLPPALGDASKYNAIGVLGLNTDLNSNNSDNILCLGGGVTPSCPTGAEYNACPGTVILNHFAENASDPVIDLLGNSPSQVNTELTIVPCSEDFENQAPARITVQFRLTNEFEELFSASTTVTCWANFELDDVGLVFDIRFLGTRFVQTRLSSPDEQAGFVAVSEEFHQQGMPAVVSRAAFNLHGEGDRVNGDVIHIPEGP
jgi:hypothetical protein